jgi:hypothetical protein
VKDPRQVRNHRPVADPEEVGLLEQAGEPVVAEALVQRPPVQFPIVTGLGQEELSVVELDCVGPARVDPVTTAVLPAKCLPAVVSVIPTHP